MRIKITLLIVCFNIVSFTFSQNFQSKVFTSEEGLPDNYVYTLTQDKEGFLWISTTKGLVKFDGQLFKSVELDSIAVGDFVCSSATKKDGDLWLGTFGGTLYKKTASQTKPELLYQSIGASANQLVVSKFSNDVFLVCNGKGLIVYRNNKLVSMESTKGIQINGLAELDDQNVLLCTDEGLKIVNTNTQKTQAIKGFEADYRKVQALQFKPKRFLFYQQNLGILEIELHLNSSLEWEAKTEHIFENSNLDLSTFFYNEKEGDLYLGTKDEKFYILHPAQKRSMELPHEEFSGMANTIFVDNETNVWVCTSGNGMYRLNKKECEVVATNNEPVYCISQNNTGTETYFGTDEGIQVLNKNGELIRRISKLGNQTLKKITALYMDKQNALWVGTSDQSLFVFNPQTMEQFKVEFSDIPNISINSISGNSFDEEINVNTNLNGVFTYNRYTLINHFSSENSLLHNNVYYSLKLKNGKVYYATHNTAFNVSKNKQLYEMDVRNNGMISDFNTFCENRNGELVIGTNGDGLYFLNDTVISPFEKNEVFKSKYCNGLVRDKQGCLWILTRDQLYRFYADNNVINEVQLNNEKDLRLNSNAFYLSTQGDLFFGTNNQVLLFRTNTSSSLKSVLPKTYLVEIQLSDSTQHFDTKNNLPYGRYDIDFKYSALSLKNAEQVQYRYMLEGRDSKWSEFTKLKHIEFSNLSDGNYTFKLQAINSDGFLELKPTSFSFSIQQPYWKRVWFWSSLALCLVITVMVIVRLRIANLIKAKEKLEKIVDEKTSELRKEKELVEANHKIITKQNEDITSSIEYAQRIQEAILPQTSNQTGQLQNVLIYYRPKDIVSGDFYWFQQKNNRLLIAACDCTGHGVPGAFMSMIGTTLLNKIVLDKGHTNPEKILFQMDKEITNSLKQKENELRDGMEAGLCSIDFENYRIEYSGAKRPLWVYRSTKSGFEFSEVKGDKFPIGGYEAAMTKTYALNSIQLQQGDMVYLFSDGMIDQFNGIDRKRLSSKRLREFLNGVAGLTLTDQHKALEDFMIDWQGHESQTDDMLLLGIRM